MFGLVSNASLRDDDEDEERGNSRSSDSAGGAVAGLFGKLFGWILLVVLGVFLIPAALIALGLHKLLTKGRLRVSVVSLFVLALGLIAFATWQISHAPDQFVNFVQNIQNAGETWPTLIAPLLAVNIAIGALLGFMTVAWSARNLRKTPYLYEQEGTWTYHFAYRRTPFEWFRLQKRKKALATQDMGNEERAALGVNLEDDEITYRYYREANKQTLVTGGVGSGKALSGSTWLPTPMGFKQVRDVLEGDQLLDDRGLATTVVAKHQPKTPDHFELIVDSEIALDACGDHRWPVRVMKGDGFDERVLTTREIASTVRTTEVYMRRLIEPADYPTAPLDDFREAGEESGSHATITDCHMIADVTQRLELLDSALRSSGARAARTLVFRSEIRDQIVRLQSVARSLGIATSHVFSKHGQWEFATEIHPGLSFAGLPHDGDDPYPVDSSDLRQVTSVEPLNSDPEDYYCFEVDAESHLFLCTDAYLVTHNTVSILNMILADIKHGVAVIAVDFKRDPAFAARLAYWAKEYDREFYHFTSGAPEKYSITTNPLGQAQYDALHSSSPAVRADMVLGMREYDTNSAVYKSNMQQLLQVLFSAIDEADRSKAPNIDWDSGGLQQIASCIEKDNLTDLAAACEGKRIEKDILAIRDQAKGKTQIMHALEELQGQMRTLTASQYGRWMRTDASKRNIDLFGLTSDAEAPPVVLFSIDSDSEEEFSSYLGSLIMADITNVSAMRRNAKLKNQVMVYVDEFQAVPPSAVRSLLEKSRASHLAMTLSVQSFEQIIQKAKGDGEATLKGILDTCGNFLVHSGAINPSAIRLSEIQGEDDFPTYRTSRKDENFFLRFNWANRRNPIVQSGTETRWITPPREFMNLSAPSEANNFTATAMLLTKAVEDKRYKSTGAISRKIQVIPNEEVLDESLFEDAEMESDEPMVIESEVIGESHEASEDTEVEAESDPKSDSKPQTKTIVENSVGDDPDWAEENPDDGNSDFQFLNHPQPKNRSKTPEELEAEFNAELPSLGSLHDDELFDSGEFKPQTLKRSRPKSEQPKPKPKEEPPAPFGQLPPLD